LPRGVPRSASANPRSYVVTATDTPQARLAIFVIAGFGLRQQRCHFNGCSGFAIFLSLLGEAQSSQGHLDKCDPRTKTNQAVKQQESTATGR